MKRFFYNTILVLSALATVLCACHKEEKIVPVESISLSTPSSELEVGGTLQLTATITPSTATDKTVGWTSSNASIATVSPTGLISAIAEGKCTITATSNGKTATCAITVKKAVIAVSSIELDKTDIKMYVGDEEVIKAIIKPDEATDKTVTWGSSKPGVAIVNSNGIIQAIAEGVTSITASCGGKTATCKVTVNTVISSVELNETDLIISIGDSETLVATVKPDNASDKTVIWSSSNPSVVSVDENGLVNALAEGIATITATCGGKSAICKFTVKAHTYETSYFTIKALESSTLKWNVENVEYSLDRKNWKLWTGSLSFQKDDAIMFRGENNTYEDKSIESTGKINVEGNIMSLLYGKKFIDKNTLRKSSSMPEYIFKGLFRDNDKLISGENLIILAADVRGCYNEFFQNCSQMTIGPNITVPKVEVNSCRAMFAYCISLAVAPKLPSTDLSYFCYCDMFRNCKSLTTAPELPATTVPQSAYNSMFYDCSALTKAPALPAKNIGTQAYRYMFHYCTSLTEAPALPATTLAYGCYELMFRGTSIYEAPELPATTLADNCYGSMFSFCPNLRKAPVLPAKVLVKGCYSTMFIGTPINYIKCLAEDVSAEDCTTAWLGHMYGTGPASAGTFVKSSSMNSWPTGDDGIPEGWTVINAD